MSDAASSASRTRSQASGRTGRPDRRMGIVEGSGTEKKRASSPSSRSLVRRKSRSRSQASGSRPDRRMRKVVGSGTEKKIASPSNSRSLFRRTSSDDQLLSTELGANLRNRTSGREKRASSKRLIRRTRSDDQMLSTSIGVRPRSPRSPRRIFKRQKSDLDVAALRRVSFELDENDAIVEHTFFAPNKRSLSEREVEVCWWNDAHRSRSSKEAAALSKALLNGDTMYGEAMQNLLAFCSSRDAAKATSLSTMALEHKRLLAVILDGNARGLEFHACTLLQQRKDESIKVVLEAQRTVSGPTQKKASANMIALQYRCVSQYALYLSRMLANADELDASSSSSSNAKMAYLRASLS